MRLSAIGSDIAECLSLSVHCQGTEVPDIAYSDTTVVTRRRSRDAISETMGARLRYCLTVEREVAPAKGAWEEGWGQGRVADKS